MCAIIGYIGSAVSEEILTEGFFRTKSRGPDDSRVVRIGDSVFLGFHRLAIMGLHPEGMQPFCLDGDLLVCNGEIYGFRQMRERLRSLGYSFEGESDCEILLPLWRERGVSMFPELDAEFALILYDSRSGSLVAARDPIGIRPLYYGYDADGAIMFASEAKNLVGIADGIAPFPPGCYYRDGEFVRYRDPASAGEACGNDVKLICSGIRQRLTEAVAKRLDSDTPLGFLLSGGLDSSLVCAISARLLKRPVRTFAIGMSEDAIDLKYARMAAEHIGADHTEVYMTPDEVVGSLEEVISALGTYDITTVRASIGMYLVCRYISRETDVRVIMTGEVSDELFGYKYTDYAPSAEEFQREAEKRVRELHMYDVLRADRCISANSLEARVPFGDLEFVRYVMSIDPALKMNRWGQGKYLLRRAFDGDLLPDAILNREKAAFSDAVGHSMVDYLKRYAEGCYSDEEYERRRLRYDFARPFTKESLLYREIFERYYPGCAGTVKDFWMPNRSWEGCDVDDPSARVLANYGASGE